MRIVGMYLRMFGRCICQVFRDTTWLGRKEQKHYGDDQLASDSGSEAFFSA